MLSTTVAAQETNFYRFYRKIAPQKETHERSSLPSKNFPCISMDMLQIGALVLLGRLVEAQRAKLTLSFTLITNKALLIMFTCDSAHNNYKGA